MTSETTKMIKRITRHLKGCSSHDCVVNGPHGNMGAGECKCFHNASRFELIRMESEIKSILYENKNES